MVRSRSAVRWAPAAALTIAPLAVGAQPTRRPWSVAFRAEQLHVGRYYDRTVGETTATTDGGTITTRDETTLRLAPQMGLAATIALHPRERWSVAVDVAYGRGAGASRLGSSASRRDVGGETVAGGGLGWSFDGRASAWRLGAGGARRAALGARGRLVAHAGAEASLLAVQLELPTRGDPLPPTTGVTRNAPGAARTRRYWSPGVSLTTGAGYRLTSDVALTLRGTGGVFRADGEGVAHDFADAALLVSSPPRPAGRAQWRPGATLGVGVSYTAGSRRTSR